MKCQHCLKENERSIQEQGYGRSFIPNYFDCTTHRVGRLLALKEENEITEEKEKELSLYAKVINYFFGR